MAAVTLTPPPDHQHQRFLKRELIMSVEVVHPVAPPRIVVTDSYHPLQQEQDMQMDSQRAGPSWASSIMDLDSSHFLSVPGGHWSFEVEKMLDVLPPPPNYPKGTCGVCKEYVSGPSAFLIPDCAHIFCKDCLRQWTITSIEGRRYPVLCPVCMVADRTSKNYVPDDDFPRLELPDRQRQIHQDLQLAQHAMPLHCPKCKTDMHVDREDYLLYKDVTCPVSGCGHRWCTDCRKAIPAHEMKHHCKNKKLDRLVRRKGWRYCPGCRIPIQKASGCNHMICGAPGCNVHFCYTCAGLIYDPSDPSSSDTSMTMSIITHYTHCRQFSRAATIRQGARRVARGTAKLVFRMLGL